MYVLVFKRLSTNRLYAGKAAERAMLTARLTGITVLQHRYYDYNYKAHALSAFLIR